MKRLLSLCLLLCLLTTTFAVYPRQEDTVRLNAYVKATPDNAVSRLQKRLEAGTTTLSWGSRGYLDSLLKELNIAPDSQVLVFSKTSLQRDKISPQTPRAIYFNDEVYVGWCLDGTVIEISIADTVWGSVFYTLSQVKTGKPSLKRQTYDCLQCHQSALTQNIPGHMMRSVTAQIDGTPDLSKGSKITTDQSPFSERWGGWYVSGRYGKTQHQGKNITGLRPLFDTKPYKTPHSDIVALMVLAHQTHVHNLLAKANFLVQDALEYEQEMNKALSETGRRESTTRRIASACEPLLESLLFCEEAPFRSPITGTTSFAAQFATRASKAQKDKQGRRLRQLDLTRRLLRYPCSYLIYSDSFNALPSEAKSYLYTRLHQVLEGQENTENNKKFSHLTPQDKKNIHEILLATKPEYHL
jgi:hypothetical protein